MKIVFLFFIALIFLGYFSKNRSEQKITVADSSDFEVCKSNDKFLHDTFARIGPQEFISEFKACYSLLKDQSDWAPLKSKVQIYKDEFTKSDAIMNAEAKVEKANVLLLHFPRDKKLTAILNKAEKDLKKDALRNKTAKGDAKAKTESLPNNFTKPMSFEKCLSTTNQTLTELAQPFNVVVNTKTVRVVKVLTKEGSVIITCSKPDNHMSVSTHVYED